MITTATTDIKGAGHLFTVVTVPPDNGEEWQLYSGSFNIPRFPLLTCSIWHHWAPGTAGNAACTRGELGAADTAQARRLFSDSNSLSAMLRIEHFITSRLSYMVRNKRGLLYLQESFQESLRWHYVWLFGKQSQLRVIKVVLLHRCALSSVFCGFDLSCENT